MSHRLDYKMCLLILVLLFEACAEGGPPPASNVINPGLGGGRGGGEVPGGEGGQGPNLADSEGRPTLMRIGDKVAIVGESLSIQLQAQDPQNDLLSFSLRSALPEGAKFQKEIGLFDWTPVPDQSGRSFLLTFEVSDGDLRDQETIAVRVSAAGSQADLPPEIDVISDQLLTVGQMWTYPLVGEDPNGQMLSYRVDGDLPLGLMLNPNTGLLQWIPMAADVGRYDLVAAVSDGTSEATTPLRLIVRDANDQTSMNTPPMFNPVPPQQVEAGMTLMFEVSAVDETPMNLMYAAEMIPDGSEFNPNTRQFIWTPMPELAGTSHDAILLVSDGEFRSFIRVSIEVTAPIRSCPPDPTGISGGELPLAEGMLRGRILCDESEVDQYLITLDQAARVDLTVSFDSTEGDIDVFLYKSDGTQIASAEGALSEERITTSALNAGQYRLAVRLYDEGGPISYDINYTLIEPGDVCSPDLYDQPSNNQEGSAAVIPTDELLSLSLCRGDLDFFTFNVERGTSFEIDATFSHSIADLDLRLIGPPVGDAEINSYWSSSSTTDDENITVDSAPVGGQYTLEVRTLNMTADLEYDLSVLMGAPPSCNEDRLESSNNDSEQEAEALTPELYYDLTACVDEDWYSTQVPAGRSLILYLTYDEGMPIIKARGLAGVLPSTPLQFNQPVDGCLTQRARCTRYQIDPSPSGERVSYSISFFEIGVDYDLRVRVGDEVGSTCVTDSDCNLPFSCYSAFSAYDFPEGLCAESCASDAECGSQRACLRDSTGAGVCMQRCDQGLSCRPQFTCRDGISTVNGTASLCL